MTINNNQIVSTSPFISYALLTDQNSTYSLEQINQAIAQLFGLFSSSQTPTLEELTSSLSYFDELGKYLEKNPNNETNVEIAQGLQKAFKKLESDKILRLVVWTLKLHASNNAEGLNIHLIFDRLLNSICKALYLNINSEDVKPLHRIVFETISLKPKKSVSFVDQISQKVSVSENEIFYNLAAVESSLLDPIPMKDLVKLRFVSKATNAAVDLLRKHRLNKGEKPSYFRIRTLQDYITQLGTVQCSELTQIKIEEKQKINFDDISKKFPNLDTFILNVPMVSGCLKLTDLKTFTLNKLNDDGLKNLHKSIENMQCPKLENLDLNLYTRKNNNELLSLIFNKFQQLKSLTVNTSLENVELEQIANCKEIESISLIDRFCNFLISFPYIQKLKTLAIDVNGSVDLTSILKCKNLENLNLSCRGASPMDFSDMPALKDLAIRTSDQLTQINATNCPHLRKFQFKVQDFSACDLSFLINLKQLTEIDLTNIKDTNSFTFLDKLFNLESFKLNYQEPIEIEVMKNNDSVKYLEFTGVSIGKSIDCFPNLKKAVFTSCNSFQPSIKFEHLDEAEFSDCELKNLDFLKYLPNLTELHIKLGSQSNNLTDISHLSHCPKLTKIKIEQASDAWSSIEKFNWKVLKLLPNLTEIWFLGFENPPPEMIEYLKNREGIKLLF